MNCRILSAGRSAEGFGKCLLHDFCVNCKCWEAFRKKSHREWMSGKFCSKFVPSENQRLLIEKIHRDKHNRASVTKLPKDGAWHILTNKSKINKKHQALKPPALAQHKLKLSVKCTTHYVSHLNWTAVKDFFLVTKRCNQRPSTEGQKQSKN